MRFSKLIQELNYWKEISGEEDPEVVVNTPPYSYEIDGIQPVRGIENNKAIGIIFDE